MFCSTMFRARPLAALLLVLAVTIHAEELKVAPANVQAALFLKLLSFNKGIAAGGKVTLHVVGSDDFAKEMRKGIGKMIGKAELTGVTSGEELPATPPSVVYVGSSKATARVIKYTRDKDILSITGLPDQVNEGVTLGVGTASGKPSIVLSTGASKEEAVEWDPAILKIATLVE